MVTRMAAKKPPETRGGILADEMGTGKSLTLLAVVVHTLDEARTISYKNLSTPHQDQERPCTGATLIIAPKSSVCSFSFVSCLNICLCRFFSIVQLGVGD